MTLSLPRCNSLLVSRKIISLPNGHVNLVDPMIRLSAGCYPAKRALGIFASLTSAQGDYLMEVQLRTMDGEVVWRQEQRHVYSMLDPLISYHFMMNAKVVFPKPSTYYFVILANGVEIGRESFVAELIPQGELSPPNDEMWVSSQISVSYYDLDGKLLGIDNSPGHLATFVYDSTPQADTPTIVDDSGGPDL